MKEAASSLTLALDTGEFILLNRELEEGDTVIIDTNARYATVNGIDARDDVTFASTWFMLPRGEFALSVDPESTEIKITFRERWI